MKTIKHILTLMRQARQLADGRTQWAFFKPFHILNADGSVYLKRLRIFQTPWFGILLHEIRTGDPQPDLHDHPYPFLAIPLRGGYVERYTHRANSQVLPSFLREPNREAMEEIGSVVELRHHSIFRWNVMPLSAAHQIVKLARVPTWTLLFVGPRAQSWGFYTEAGFVPWMEYTDKAYEDGDESRMLRGGDGRGPVA